MWIKQLLQEEYIQIMVTAMLTSLLTYWVTRRHEWRQLNIENRSKLLKDVYAPIMKIILGGIWPLDGYDGLGDKQANNIIGIITENEVLVDTGLSNWAWSLQEDVYINGMNQVPSSHAQYDMDRHFLNYVEEEYHKLKKSVGLPYNKDSIGIRRMMKQITRSFRKSKTYGLYRKLKHKIRQNQKV